MNIQRKISLKPFNTLSIDAKAEYFVSVTDTNQLPEILTYANQYKLAILVLGGGSNIVLTKDFCGLVIHLNTKGITTSIVDSDSYLTVQAGENWHELVMESLQQKFYGLENLALIPGNVGAAAIQNIGAYGVEFISVFHSLSGWNISTQQWQTLQTEDCAFGYRDSVFKQALKDQFIITEVTLKLSQVADVNLKYQVLKNTLDAVTEPTPQQVAEAVIAIRSSKLPSPKVIPNAGSFFKNPVISAQELQRIQRTYPEVVYYALENGEVKLAAGWLIDQLGWKGKLIEGVAMHEQQALVLVNQGGSGSQVIAYAESVKADVLKHFKVPLEIEPRVY